MRELLPVGCSCIGYRPASRIKLASPTTSRGALRKRHARQQLTKAERRARNKERLRNAIRRREELVIELAPDLRCAECGEQFNHPAQLQIDHADGKAWNANKLSPTMRVARYWREYKAGVAMRALCGLCNASDGWRKRFGLERAPREVPF